MKTLLPFTCVVLSSVTLGSCWQFFTSMGDHTFFNSEAEQHLINSEYVFGNCKRKDIVLYTHTHLDNMQVVGKIMVRGWLDIKRIPTCIILRAMSHKENLFRTTAYPFQMCVPRITYCHSHKRFKYFFYEWYIPYEYAGGMNWDIYFLGSPNVEWQ